MIQCTINCNKHNIFIIILFVLLWQTFKSLAASNVPSDRFDNPRNTKPASVQLYKFKYYNTRSL